MLNFLSIFSLGVLHNDKIECDFFNRSFSFKNSKFYSYNLCIAFFEDNTLNIYKYSRKYGGTPVSHTTSKHLSNLVNLCNKFNINYNLVDIPEDEEENL